MEYPIKIQERRGLNYNNFQQEHNGDMDDNKQASHDTLIITPLTWC